MKRMAQHADIFTAQNMTDKMKSKILKDTTPTEYENDGIKTSGFTAVYDDIDLQFEKNLNKLIEDNKKIKMSIENEMNDVMNIQTGIKITKLINLAKNNITTLNNIKMNSINDPKVKNLVDEAIKYFNTNIKPKNEEFYEKRMKALGMNKIPLKAGKGIRIKRTRKGRKGRKGRKSIKRKIRYTNRRK